MSGGIEAKSHGRERGSPAAEDCQYIFNACQI